MIEIPCPGCSKIISVPDDCTGRTGTCTECHSRIRFPGGDSFRTLESRKIGRQERAVNVTLVPGAVFLALGFLSFFVSLIFLSRVATYLFLPHNLDGTTRLDFVLSALLPTWGAIVSLGGYFMVRGTHRRSCRLAAVVAMFPCSPLFVLGLPVGIWAFVILNRDDVKDGFES